MATVRARARDGCVVETRGLAALLREFYETWYRTHSDGDGDERSAPIAWLASRTGLSEETLEVLCRETPRYKTTELWIADRIVAALDRPQAFHDGTLVVRGNSLARLRLNRSVATERLAYRAQIVFAGQRVGRVYRERGDTHYRAVVGGTLIASAASMASLRTELHGRVPDVACCGGSGSVVGAVSPR